MVRKETIRQALRASSIGTLLGLLAHHAWFYASGSPLLTQHISEWIMARTPPGDTIRILDHLGPWAKPSAMTGALGTLGLAAFLIRRTDYVVSYRWRIPAMIGATFALAFGFNAVFDYHSTTGAIGFWLPLVSFVSLCLWHKPAKPDLAGFDAQGSTVLNKL